MNILQSNPEGVTRHTPAQGEQHQVGAQDNSGVYSPISGGLNGLIK